MAPTRSRSRTRTRTRTRTRSPSHNTTTSTTNPPTNRIRARLTPTTLSIPTSRVHKSWRTLSTTTQERIRTLLLSISAASQSTHLARTSKTRATHTTNPSKIPLSPAEHADAINALTQKLISRLPRMQFPPSSSTARSRGGGGGGDGGGAKAVQEGDFDYEGTLATNAALGAQLTEAERAAKVLRVSIRQEEADLKREKAELAALQENFRRGGAVVREEERRLHAVVMGLGRGVKVEDDEGAEEEAMADQMLGTARRKGVHGKGGRLLGEGAVEDDEELKVLATQLRSHLGSIAGNTASLRGVAKELKGAQSAVAAFAWKGMGKEQYERVVGLR